MKGLILFLIFGVTLFAGNVQMVNPPANVNATASVLEIPQLTINVPLDIDPVPVGLKGFKSTQTSAEIAEYIHDMGEDFLPPGAEASMLADSRTVITATSQQVLRCVISGQGANNYFKSQIVEPGTYTAAVKFSGIQNSDLAKLREYSCSIQYITDLGNYLPKHFEQAAPFEVKNSIVTGIFN